MTSPILTPDEAALPKQRVSDEQIARDVDYAVRWGLTAGDIVLMDIAYAPDARDLRAAYLKLLASHEALRRLFDASTEAIDASLAFETARADRAEAALENDKHEAEHFMRLALVDPGGLHVVTWKERALTVEAALVDAQRIGWERGRDAGAALAESKRYTLDGVQEEMLGRAIRALQPPAKLTAKEGA